ncbi:MAG: hypothetical protein KKD63_00795 [Proteobacteria bacterium]|nr:hypothetical protein [Desulfobulbaceae bacterium]MBU4151396.1 hypothetical protein [Pseudomonadota bacterium]
MRYRSGGNNVGHHGHVGGWLSLGRVRRFVGLCCLVFIVTGCATLPKRAPLSDSDAVDVRKKFKVMLNDQRQCPASFDSDVVVTINNLVWSGTISGYLKAMAPAFIRFEGINPLGLTEAILAVDGENFTYVSVRDQQAYVGPLNADLLNRYAPEGLATAMSYYWLLGRIPPGALGIGEVGRDQEGLGYWLDLRYVEGGNRSMILYSPEQQLIKRHLVLNGNGGIAVDLSYDYQGSEKAADCQLPVKIIIQGRGSGSLTLGFTKRYPTPSLDPSPFSVTPPSDYKRTVVQ